MAGHPGWYPISQVCYPPELPAYFKNISDLKPIVGVPKDTEVVAIHSVMHAANRVAGVPGMHDPKFFMKLAGHLFNVQMARYRSKYSLITFPSDATYVPPVLPAHITINLESVSGAPSDDDITKVQDAIQIHQELRRVPSMFDAHINMELSQHLFDLQMARHMCVAGEGQPIHEPQAVAIHDGPTHVVEETPDIPEEMIIATNNAGTGANATGVYQAPQLAPGIDIRELMKQSNQLAKQFNQLLERSNELAERSRQTMDQSSAHVLAERFNQVLDRITRLAETPHQPAERHDQLAERFNQLFERFNQLVEQSNQPAQRANELTERSNEFADKANQLAEQLNELFERSNQLSEQANESGERLGDILGNINKVLMRIQHAIVRNHKGNTTRALDCLVNEQGATPSMSHTTGNYTFSDFARQTSNRVSVVIDGAPQNTFVSNSWLGDFLHFYGIGDGLCESESSTRLKDGMQGAARTRLGEYLSSCLG